MTKICLSFSWVHQQNQMFIEPHFISTLEWKIFMHTYMYIYLYIVHFKTVAHFYSDILYILHQPRLPLTQTLAVFLTFLTVTVEEVEIKI